MPKILVIRKSLQILASGDQQKILAVVAIQIFFGLLDLAGVALVGILGALAITGVQSKVPGNRVSEVLQWLQIENLDLQTQATVIGILAASFSYFEDSPFRAFCSKDHVFSFQEECYISSNLISKVLSQSLSQIQRKSMQETLYSVTSGVDAIVMGIINCLVLIISDASLLIILTVGLLIVDPIVALSTFVVFSVIAYVLYHQLQVKARTLGEDERNLAIQSSEKILEVLNSYREIVVKNRRNYYASELGNLRFRLADIRAERNFMPNISKYVIEITIVVGSLMIAALQFSMNDAAHAIAVLSVFTAASTRISPALLRLQQNAIGIRANTGMAKPTLDLIESVSSLQDVPLKIDELSFNYDEFWPKIVLENLTFTYPDKAIPTIKEIALEIKPGQVVAFVGNSGAGKTTIIDLILGLIQPDSGFVTINGMNPLDAIKKWPGSIGYVPQDVMISNTTIKENVCLGYRVNEIADDEVWRALEIAQLADFVNKLPSKLSTKVGDRGTSLSGGQRQRLGIARAMFTKPKLLILDEATSSLDGSTEANITEAINSLKGDVTVVLIAHRLSTVKESDNIFFMSEGKLIDSGTFDQLKAKVPEFAEQARLMGM